MVTIPDWMSQKCLADPVQCSTMCILLCKVHVVLLLLRKIIMLNFFDFEVFKYDWLVVIINPDEQRTEVIHNDATALEAYKAAHYDDIWIGYNSRNYDQYIFKAILLGMDPKKVSDWIIKDDRKGWEYSSTFNKIQLNIYDCGSKFYSLKQLEGFMGNDVRETSVPFDIDRPLTAAELEQTIKYCQHDVEQTMEVFLKTKANFDAHVNLLKTFHLPLANISKTQAQLSALALGCTKKIWMDEWDLQIVDTLRIQKYRTVIDWFLDPQHHDYNQHLTINVCGVPHQFGFGGLHGAPDHPIHRKGLLLHVDVTSFYPSIMIRYDMLSRSVKDKAVYKQIYNTRVALKKAGKKAEQAPYKIILNATYGICKDPTSAAYDPRQANNVCINGQLLLLDLLEHLEGHCELIQSNTDGLIIQIPDTDEAFELVDDICWQWESRTGMQLGFDIITEIWQKDVNNYLFRYDDGKVEQKGAYVKLQKDLDYDMPIVNKAMIRYMLNGVPVKKTITECDDLREFQKIVKVSNKYTCAWHNRQTVQGKTFRVFASNNPFDTYIGKMKGSSGTVEKFANTPDHCFIMNCSVNGLPVPDNLDKQYYIDLACERLLQFGVR